MQKELNDLKKKLQILLEDQRELYEQINKLNKEKQEIINTATKARAHLVDEINQLYKYQHLANLLKAIKDFDF